MSRPGLLATIAVAATVLLTVAVQTVRAQSQQSAASSFASGQQSTLTAPSTSTPSSSVVPGYAGDATNLQSYSDNPTGLQNAGQTAALTDPSMALTQQGIAKRNANAVDINADWLKASLGTSIDPMAGAQGPAGTDSSSCKAITKTASTTSTSMYTCETSRQVTDTAYQCPAKLVMDVQQILTYPCTKTYDQATKTWVVSTQCLALGGSGNCTLQGETCTTPGQPYYENRNCTAGSQWTSTTKTCNQDRQVTIDTDYVYQCTAGSSACTALGRECSLTSSVCGAVTPPTYQTKSCQDGSTTSTSSASCSETRVVVVTGGPQNTYSCTEGYSGSSYPATCGSSLNVSVFPVYKYGYYLPGALEYGYNPLDACSNTYTENQSDGWYFEYDCDGPVSGSPWRGSMWLIAVAGVEGGDSWSYDGGACIGESRGCRRTDHVCTGGSGTRTINGVAVTRSCWGYTDSYQCDQTTSAPGCSVPSGYQLQSSSCSGYTNGSCTQYNKTYVDPNSGKQVSSEYWQSNCGSIGGNCSYNGSSVTEGGGTRNINGLDVYRDSWAVQKNYTCSSSQSVNTCGSTSGCSETGRSCANSGCTLYNVTYSCMTSPGSCSRTDNTYACEEQVAGGGSPTSTTKSVATDTWSNGCDAVKGDSTCSLSSQTFANGGTRNIDGLNVTRDSWSSSSSYSCSTSKAIDDCSGKVNGCTEASKTCVGTAPNGACSLWTYTYRCSADDGSGNCSVKTDTYTCTGNAGSGSGTPTKTETNVTGSHWEPTASCPAASDKACAAQESVCTEGPATKTVSGVTVSADCWARNTSYMCSTSGPQQSTCDPPPQCTFVRDECLDDPDPGAGKCITVQHVYTCSETTSTTVTETQCENKLCLGDQCFSSETQTNNELPPSFAQLSAMSQAGKDYAGTLSIMKGEALRCRKDILGFRNCCKDSGWGLDIGLAQCDDQEKKLIEAQKAKATHYVGTFCSKKSFFGACLTKSMSYCGFGGSLGRIINEAGRSQIGKGWGSAKTPDCSGFTVEQFQQLDLSNVDFSEFYKDKMDALTSPNADSTASRIQDSINNMYRQSSQGSGI